MESVFATGIHSNNDGLGRWFPKPKTWKEESPQNLEGEGENQFTISMLSPV